MLYKVLVGSTKDFVFFKGKALFPGRLLFESENLEVAKSYAKQCPHSIIVDETGKNVYEQERGEAQEEESLKEKWKKACALADKYGITKKELMYAGKTRVARIEWLEDKINSLQESKTND